MAYSVETASKILQIVKECITGKDEKYLFYFFDKEGLQEAKRIGENNLVDAIDTALDCMQYVSQEKIKDYIDTWGRTCSECNYYKMGASVPHAAMSLHQSFGHFLVAFLDASLSADNNEDRETLRAMLPSAQNILDLLERI